jgi:hypothetical protein
MKKAILILVLLLVLPVTANALQTNGHLSGPWTIKSGQTELIIYRGWPITWTVFRDHGDIDVVCHGPRTLTSIIRVTDTRTGASNALDCQTTNDLYSTLIHARRSDALRIDKTPTRRI